jgi:6-phosphogluconate dehydrogenase
VRMGMVGLGRMGANMTARLVRGGHEVVVHDVRPHVTEEVGRGGALAAFSLAELVEALEAPRAVWIMVPAGDVTSETISTIGELLTPGDVVVDGGNSHHVETIARARALGARGISLVDAGTSGGIWGLDEGYCLMVGGDRKAFERVEPVIATLAPEGGYAHVGPTGAGHFVKMVHNGIEYALMQSYAEGFELLESSDLDLDLPAIAELWRHGSVIRSWLLDLAARALSRDPTLERLSDYVEDSGEGRWTIQHAIDHAVPVPAIALALFTRFGSRQNQSFAGKLVAALREEFGGHPVRAAGEPVEASPTPPKP